MRSRERQSPHLSLRGGDGWLDLRLCRSGLLRGLQKTEAFSAGRRRKKSLFFCDPRGSLGPNQTKSLGHCSMGPCQSSFCGLTMSEVIARARGVGPGKVGYWPPITRLPESPALPDNYRRIICGQGAANRAETRSFAFPM